MKKVKISYENFIAQQQGSALSKRNHCDMKMLESDRDIFVIFMSHSFL